MTDDLELRIIEIPKAKRILEKEEHNRIAQWLTFIDDPNTERVEKIMSENEEVKKAKSVLHIMSEDEELQRLAELKEKWDLDERSARQSALDEGEEKGKQKGEQKAKREISKKMKQKNMSIEEICEITGLTKEEIEKL